MTNLENTHHKSFTNYNIKHKRFVQQGFANSTPVLVRFYPNKIFAKWNKVLRVVFFLNAFVLTMARALHGL